MLVLSRKVSEGIVLVNRSDQPVVLQPGQVLAEIKVSYLRGRKVGLGFVADHQIAFIREELLKQPTESVVQVSTSSVV